MATLLRPIHPKLALPRAASSRSSFLSSAAAQFRQTTRASPTKRRFLSTTTIRLSQAQQTRPKSKVYDTADAAVADIQSGSTILSSGFGLCGIAGMLYSRSVMGSLSACDKKGTRIREEKIIKVNDFQKPLFKPSTVEAANRYTR